MHFTKLNYWLVVVVIIIVGYPDARHNKKVLLNSFRMVFSAVFSVCLIESLTV